MTILEALQNAREMLEALGIRGGDIYDDLNLAICMLQNKHPEVCMEELYAVR